MEKYPCPHGKQEGALVICTAPAEKTGAWKEWQTFEKDGLIVTPSFCVQTCPLDVPKPTLSRE